MNAIGHEVASRCTREDFNAEQRLDGLTARLELETVQVQVSRGNSRSIRPFSETPENIKGINMAFLKEDKIKVSDEPGLIPPRFKAV